MFNMAIVFAQSFLYRLLQHPPDQSRVHDHPGELPGRDQHHPRLRGRLVFCQGVVGRVDDVEELPELALVELIGILAKLGKGGFRFHLDLVGLSVDRVLELDIRKLHRLTDDAPPPPARSRKDQIDEHLEIPPVQVPDQGLGPADQVLACVDDRDILGRMLAVDQAPEGIERPDRTGGCPEGLQLGNGPGNRIDQEHFAPEAPIMPAAVGQAVFGYLVLADRTILQPAPPEL